VNDETTIDEQDINRWRLSLSEAIKDNEEPVLITTFRRYLTSSARPVFARGIGKCEYVVKGKQAGRQIITDHIVARLGLAMGSPVGEAQIVEISPDLLEAEFAFLSPGKAHATIFIPNCFDDRDTRIYKDHSGNGERFALLSVLFGWVESQDEQFIYQKTHPCLVYSVDHGRFFPGGYDWSIETLKSASKAQVNRQLVVSCELTNDEISTALSRLEQVTEEKIIQAVARPPDEWGITMDERIAIVEFLIKRQYELLEYL
jgi:hypothetical protein